MKTQDERIKDDKNKLSITKYVYICQYIDKDITQKIKKICRNNELSIYIYVLSCFGGLIYLNTKYSNFKFFIPYLREHSKITSLDISIKSGQSVKNSILQISSQISKLNIQEMKEKINIDNKKIIISSQQIFGDIPDILQKKIDTWQILLDHSVNQDNIKIDAYFNSKTYSLEFANNIIRNLINIIKWSVSNLEAAYDEFQKIDLAEMIIKKEDDSRKRTGYDIKKIEDVISVLKDILKVEQITLDDNFFKLGGDSLKAILISSRLLKMNYSIDVNLILSEPLIRDICNNTKQDIVKVKQEYIVGDAALTPIQQHFVKYIKTDFHYYNQSVMIYNKSGWNDISIKKTLLDIISHHDALRCVFKNHNGEKQLLYREYSEDIVNLFICDITQMSFDECQEFIIKKNSTKQQEQDIQNNSMICAILYRTIIGDHLFLAIHHMVIDGISWHILLEDFYGIYNKYENNMPYEIPKKTTSFFEWSHKLQKIAKTKEMNMELAYWRQVESKIENNLSVNRALSPIRLKDICRRTVLILEKDLNMEKSAKANILSVSLGALIVAVYVISGQKSCTISLESHGRTPLDNSIDISRTIGCFSCTYPFTLYYFDEDEDLLSYIQKALNDVPNQGIGYGVVRYLYQKGENMGPLPQIIFNYLGDFFEDEKKREFALSPFKTGDSISQNSEREYVIDIKGQIVERQLQFTFDYNKEQLKDYDMELFVETYKKTLLRLINYYNTSVQVGKQTINKSQMLDIISHLNQIEG